MTKMIVSALVAAILMAFGTMSAEAATTRDDGHSVRKASLHHKSRHYRTAHRHTYRTVHRRSTSDDYADDDDSFGDSRPQRRGTGRRQLHSLSGGSMTGVASFYSEPQRTASGGRFNPNAMTAAHRTLPFGTRVRVTSLSSGRSVNVTINDRGPYVGGRVIDLSSAAAGAIGMRSAGVARVKLEVLGR